jgi:hypothetical protein
MAVSARVNVPTTGTGLGHGIAQIFARRGHTGRGFGAALVNRP